MNITLLKKLTEIGVIKQNTEIEASYMGVDMSGSQIARSTGTFFLRSVSILKNKTATFRAVSTDDGIERTLLSENVRSIDGMPIEKLAAIYGIAADGGKLVQGKRRGRRPREKKKVAA